MKDTIITTDPAIAAEALRMGKIIGMPTETVYGLAAAIDSVEALKSIFEIKQRPYNNPLILHIYDVNQLEDIAISVSGSAKALAEAFWPGPLTLLLRKAPSVPDIVTAGLDTVAVRIPGHPLALELLRKVNKPVAAPSANPFGQISPTEAAHVAGYFNAQIPIILDGGPCTVGFESTIVGFNDERAVIYRHGSITQTQIAEVCKTATVDGSAEKAIVAPGMYLRHYAPRTPLLFSSDLAALIKRYAGCKIGLLYYNQYTPDFISCATVAQNIERVR